MSGDEEDNAGVTEFQRRIDEYRATLFGLEQQMQSAYDKAVMTLSGGALGISLAETDIGRSCAPSAASEAFGTHAEANIGRSIDRQGTPDKGRWVSAVGFPVGGKTFRAGRGGASA